MDDLNHSFQKVCNQVVEMSVNSRAISETINDVLKNKTSQKFKDFFDQCLETLKENVAESFEEYCDKLDLTKKLDQNLVIEKENVSADEEYLDKLIDHRKELESVLKVMKKDVENESKILEKEMQQLEN